ncbi:hypothetical protein [Alcaligenes aquatilis]|uniref:hypothetical protein n=1 Tax=Alcaligenes aquatilis TaxID=323284 RepID=UPI0036127758
MRTLYILRVIVVSVETLILAGAWLAFVYFESELESLASSLSLNNEVLNYLMLLPTVLAAWIINEIRVLLQEDKETIRILTNWADYWRLKIHTWTSLGFAGLFTIMSFLPWVVKSGVGTGTGLLLFVASLVGQLCLAISVYAARIRVKEIIAHVKVP